MQNQYNLNELNKIAVNLQNAAPYFHYILYLK
jgi:hypothetical protein